MTPASHTFLSLDLPPLLAGTFVALSCALLGNYLVLRRLSLMGDAIAHAVLPGIVVAFLLTSVRTPLPMFLGALASGLATVALVSLIQRFTRVEPSAAIGVVFSILFALGVLLLEQAAARHVDLDAECVLMGQMETLWWSPPADWDSLLQWKTIVGHVDPDTGARVAGFPRHVASMGLVTLLVIAFVSLFYKELRLVSFDPALATSLGINASLMHFLLMVFVAVAAVSAFEAVGSILVIAMLIGPPATARLLTDRMGTQLLASAAIALLTAVGGYLLATRATFWVGLEFAVSASGMMAVTAGLLLAAGVVGAPRHGILARHVRRLALAVRIAREDLLAALYRLEETSGGGPGLPGPEAAHPSTPRDEMIRQILSRNDLPARLARRRALRQGEVMQGGIASRRPAETAGAATDHVTPHATPIRRTHERRVAMPDLTLTPKGRRLAATIIRSHRLWETYLVETVGLRPDHVHDTAMILEHVTTPSGRRIHPEPARAPQKDPHGRAIPRTSTPESDPPPAS